MICVLTAKFTFFQDFTAENFGTNFHLDLEHYFHRKTTQIYGKERLWDKNQMEQVSGLLVGNSVIYLRFIYLI